MSTNLALACCNGGFTLLAVLCMLAGYRAIRRGQQGRHRALMLSAFGFSAAFLVCFVIRYVTFGFTDFAGQGLARGAFTALLVSHEALSVPTVALVVGTVILGLRRRYSIHRELAKLTFPLWLFVSLSGLVIFTLLYVV
jgi:putative membrane protein